MEIDSPINFIRFSSLVISVSLLRFTFSSQTKNIDDKMNKKKQTNMFIFNPYDKLLFSSKNKNLFFICVFIWTWWVLIIFIAPFPLRWNIFSPVEAAGGLTWRTMVYLVADACKCIIQTHNHRYNYLRQIIIHSEFGTIISQLQFSYLSISSRTGIAFHYGNSAS